MNSKVDPACNGNIKIGSFELREECDAKMRALKCGSQRNGSSWIQNDILICIPIRCLLQNGELFSNIFRGYILPKLKWMGMER